MLDLKRGLKGTTPESLARALLKAPYRPLAARHAGKSVVSDEVSVEELPTGQAYHQWIRRGAWMPINCSRKMLGPA